MANAESKKFTYHKDEQFFYIQQNEIKRGVSAGWYDNGKDTIVLCMVEVDDKWNTSALANSFSDCFDTFEEAANRMRDNCEQMILDSKKELEM